MRTYHGLEELEIGPELRPLRQLVPSVKDLGGIDEPGELIFAELPRAGKGD